MKEKHASENEKFSATIPKKFRKEWTVMICKWESDKSNPNPYTHTEKGFYSEIIHRTSVTYILPASNLAEVRQKLTEADKEELSRGNTSHQVPASVFVRNGLELEEQQSVPLFPMCMFHMLTD